MSLLLYMDQHVPAAVTRGLRRRGIDVLTAHEDGAAEWEDEEILQRATELGRVVYTQDDDFLELAYRWQSSSREYAGIVYAHQLNITVGQAIKDLELVAKIMRADEMRSRVEFLPLR